MRLLLAACLLVTTTSAVASAQWTSPSLDLRATAAAVAEEQKQEGKKKKKGEIRFTWKNHPSLRFGNHARIDFRARFQTDTRRSDALLQTDDGEESTFDVARRRIGIDGTLGKFADFQVERELKNDDPWRDVYLNYSQFTVVQVQAGKFKLPFSLDETTGATNLDFVYRSLTARHLAPGRDRGVMVHGRLFGRTLDYEAGAFEHDGDNARTKSGTRVFAGRTFAVRVAAEPFRPSKSAFEDFHVGVAFTRGEVPLGFGGLRGRTVFDETFFSSKVYVNGERQRMGLEFRVRPGPVSLKAEYVRATDQRLGQSVEDGDLSNLVARGWYVSGTYAITGEPKSKGLDEPLHPFLRGGAGAIEIAARVEQLEFGSDGGVGPPSTSPRSDNIQGNSDRAFTFGVNWYLNRWIKVQGNIIREEIADPARGPLPDRSRFWSRVFRLQFVI